MAQPPQPQPGDSMDTYLHTNGWQGDFGRPPAKPAYPAPAALPAPPPRQPATPARPTLWEPFTVDVPGHVFEPKPPTGPSYRPDTVFDGWSTEQLTIRLASVRGNLHRYRGRPREDDVAVALHSGSGTLVFAVADGVSDAVQPHMGATMVCRTAVDDLLTQLGERRQSLDWQRTVESAAWQLVARVASGPEPTEADKREAERQFATTLVTGVVALRGPVPQVTVVGVGDSGAWVLRQDHFERLLGGKAVTRDEVISSAVSPLPRVPKVVPQQVELTPDAVLLVGTDGFGDVLGTSGRGPAADLFRHELRTPPPARGFAHLLDFGHDTFDDDRTLLAVWPRHLLREPGR